MEIRNCVLVFWIFSSVSAEKFSYPLTRRDDNAGDIYNGMKVNQPYGWMVEENNTADLENHIKAQDAFAKEYLLGCKKQSKYEELVENSKNMGEYADFGKLGGRYYFKHKNASDTEWYWYVQNTSESSEAVKLPSGKGYPVDNGLLLYFDDDKSAFVVWNISDPSTPRIIEEIITDQIVYSSDYEWLDDGSGFFYRLVKKTVHPDTEDEIDVPYIYFHKIGSLEDILVVKPTEQFCLKDTYCDTNQMIALNSNEGQYLFTITYSKVEKKNKFYYNILRLNWTSIEDSNIIQVIPPTEFVDDSDRKLYIFERRNLSFYFFNEYDFPYKIQRFDVNFTTNEGQWTTIFELENRDEEFYDVTGVDGNKMVVGIKNKSDSFKQRTEIRDINNGSLIRSFPSIYYRKFWFSSSIDDPEIIFISSKLDKLNEVYSLDASSSNSTMKIIKKQPISVNLQKITYKSSVQNHNKSSFTMFHNQKDFKNNITEPIYIYLNGEDVITHTDFALIAETNAFIIVHKPLIHASTLKKDPFFATMVEAEEEIQNIIQIGKLLRQEKEYSNIVLIGVGKYAAMASTAVNRHPELFGGLVLSKPDSNFNPFTDTGVCPDGFYNQYCSKINAVLNDLPHKLYPIGNVNTSQRYPFVVLNMFETPLANDETVDDILGLQYITELQHQFNVSENVWPFVTLLADDLHDYVYAEAIGRFEDFMCILEQTISTIDKFTKLNTTSQQEATTTTTISTTSLPTTTPATLNSTSAPTS